MVADVRERRKEFGESEVEFSCITGVDARICWLRNPMQAPPICESRLQSEANHECITGVGSETVSIHVFSGMTLGRGCLATCLITSVHTMGPIQLPSIDNRLSNTRVCNCC